MINVTVIGNVVKDATVREAGSMKVCSFSLACHTNRKGADGNYETEFIDCNLWGKRGENVAQYIKRGMKMTVVGSEWIRRFEYNGEKRFGVNIEVQDFEFGSKPAAGGNVPAAAAPAPAEDTSLPF